MNFGILSAIMVQLTLSGISKHLTEGIVNEIFKLKTGSDDYVKSIEVTRAAPAGEGLLSAVYRIKVTGDKHSASFIVKGLITDPVLKKSIAAPPYFAREALFFSKVLPGLIEVQRLSGAKETIANHVPMSYSIHLDGCDDFILMEDLSESNCMSLGVLPTTQQRDLILRALSHLHATSMALRVKRPDEFARLQSGLPEIYYTDSNRGWYTGYLQRAIELDKKIIYEYEDPSSMYYKKFTELVDGDVYGKIINVTSTWGEHPVIAHGDAWCPNFLCTENKAVMIDFQLLRCASPATDLAIFAILSCSLGSAKEHFLSAVEAYYAGLQYFLIDMGLDPQQVFTRMDLDNELRTYGKFGLMAALTTIPLMYSERCDVMQNSDERFFGLEKIPLEELWLLTPLKNEKEKMALVNAVRVAVDVGLL